MGEDGGVDASDLTASHDQLVDWLDRAPPRLPEEAAATYGVTLDELTRFVRVHERPRYAIWAVAFGHAPGFVGEFWSTELRHLETFGWYARRSVLASEDSALLALAAEADGVLSSAQERQEARSERAVHDDGRQWLVRHRAKLANALAGEDFAKFDRLWGDATLHILTFQELCEVAREFGDDWHPNDDQSFCPGQWARGRGPAPPVRRWDPDRAAMLSSLDRLLSRSRGRAGARGSRDYDQAVICLWRHHRELTGAWGQERFLRFANDLLARYKLTEASKQTLRRLRDEALRPVGF